MTRKSRRVLCLVLTVALAVAACGDDDAATTTAELTETTTTIEATTIEARTTVEEAVTTVAREPAKYEPPDGTVIVFWGTGQRLGGRQRRVR